MTQIIEAIYEDGVLRPLQPLKDIEEHSKVKIIIETETQPRHPLADCIGILPDEDAREMRRIIEEEFEEAKATTASVYAQIRMQLKQKGKPIPENDLWIAALCVEHGIPLATEDTHFSEVDGLIVEKR